MRNNKHEDGEGEGQMRGDESEEGRSSKGGGGWWGKQITMRGIVGSGGIGVIYSIIAMKLSLTTGLSPNLNVSAALLGFVWVKGWTKLLQNLGFSPLPFTRQENTMIQTCAVACYSIANGGGFGSYLLGLNQKTYELAGGDTTPGNSSASYKELKLGWITAYLFLVSFVGLFVLIPLRKILIIDYKLVFPSGMATAVLINGFHTMGDQMARKQVRGFLKYFSMSFLWGFFQWFYSGEQNCAGGFNQFPTFGLQAWKQKFYFDFSMTYVGTGMICSHLVSLSLLVGAVVSWGVMWPLINLRSGDWFPSNVSEESMRGLNGYKVFISIALIFGDGLYNFVKVLLIILINVRGRMRRNNNNRSAEEGTDVDDEAEGAADADADAANSNMDQQEVTSRGKKAAFVRESIPMWVAGGGYLLLSLVSTIALPIIFPEIKWYYVTVAYILAPPFAFCNAYGAGLTDMNMAYNYGKVALFVLAAIAGKQDGVVAALVGCGLLKSIVLLSCTLMQDFKTGYLTIASPRGMLLSQAIGTAIGCVVAPLTFFMFYRAFDIGNPQGEYKAPYALIYRNMAILGVEGLSALPRHCLQLCCAFFTFAVAINLVRDLFLSNPNPKAKQLGKWLPLPMVMAVPFLVGGYFAIDMCVGSFVVFVWNIRNPKKAEMMIPAVASGLICGEGLWSLPASLLALAKVDPPMCMTFLPSSTTSS